MDIFLCLFSSRLTSRNVKCHPLKKQEREKQEIQQHREHHNLTCRSKIWPALPPQFSKWRNWKSKKKHGKIWKRTIPTFSDPSWDIRWLKWWSLRCHSERNPRGFPCCYSFFIPYAAQSWLICFPIEVFINGDLEARNKCSDTHGKCCSNESVNFLPFPTKTALSRSLSSSFTPISRIWFSDSLTSLPSIRETTRLPVCHGYFCTFFCRESKITEREMPNSSNNCYVESLMKPQHCDRKYEYFPDRSRLLFPQIELNSIGGK